jgi:hypothetical protein
MDFFVVFVDSNPANVVAFFPAAYFTLAQVQAWRDANFPAGDVVAAEIDSYRLVTETTVNL